MIQGVELHTRLDALPKPGLSETQTVLVTGLKEASQDRPTATPTNTFERFTSAALSRRHQRRLQQQQSSAHHSTQTKLILISRFTLLIVILNCISLTTECDSQLHIFDY